MFCNQAEKIVKFIQENTSHQGLISINCLLENLRVQIINAWVTNKESAGCFLPVHQFKDSRHCSGAVRFQDILLKQSQIKQVPDGSFFQNAMRILFRSERHRVVTSRRSGRSWTATGQRPHEHLSVIEHSLCKLCYHFCSPIR